MSNQVHPHTHTSNKLYTQSTQWGGKGTEQGESEAGVSVPPIALTPGLEATHSLTSLEEKSR